MAVTEETSNKGALRLRQRKNDAPPPLGMTTWDWIRKEFAAKVAAVAISLRLLPVVLY